MSRAIERLCFVEPQLLTPIEQPPQGSNWIHEVKHDGYRTILVIECGKDVLTPATASIGATVTPTS